jgi:hypothetical protein
MITLNINNILKTIKKIDLKKEKEKRLNIFNASQPWWQMLFNIKLKPDFFCQNHEYLF